MIESGLLIFHAGEDQVELPLDDIQMKRGGASDRLLFFSSPSVPGWTIYTHQRQIMNHPDLRTYRQADTERQKIGREKWGARGLALGLLGLVGLVLFGVYLLKDPAVGLIARQIPPEMELALGEAAFSSISESATLLDSRKIQSEVDRLVQPLLNAINSDRYTFQFHVLDDSSINAFAMPGGIVVLHTGLILKAERTEQILGVVAHEIAHVTEQHSMRSLIEQVALVAGLQLLFGDASALTAILVDNSAALLRLQFSREHETEADRVGLDYLVQANIDPRGLVEFFDLLRQAEEERGGSAPPLEFLSTHPATERRMKMLDKAIDALGARSYEEMEFDLSAFQDIIEAEIRTSL